MSFDDSRTALIKHFLAEAGWGDASMDWLGQDASTRNYARLTRGDTTAIR